MGVKITCPACQGAKCDACAGKGRIRALCRCGHAADLLAGDVPLCEGCAALCAYCGRFVDRQDDGLPFAGKGLAHTACALAASAAAATEGRYLEAPKEPVESDLAFDGVLPVNKSTSSPPGPYAEDIKTHPGPNALGRVHFDL